MPRQTFSPERFEQIRADNPDLGFAFYAYEPGAPVTFEVLTPDGQTFTFRGPTLGAAMEQAFPSQPAPEPPQPSDMTTDIFD